MSFKILSSTSQRGSVAGSRSGVNNDNALPVLAIGASKVLLKLRMTPDLKIADHFKQYAMEDWLVV
jgi:hypothetical protein